MLLYRLLVGARRSTPLAGCVNIFGDCLSLLTTSKHTDGNASSPYSLSQLFQQELTIPVRHSHPIPSLVHAYGTTLNNTASPLQKVQAFNLAHVRQLNSRLVARLPPSVQPYAFLMRMDKPTGTWLLLWPCYWSIAMAAAPGSFPDAWMLFLFGTGSVLLRGAGCTVNDLWDRDLDQKVERTRTRPLASGALTPAHAVGLLAAQLAAGLWILLQLNGYSQVLGASSLLLVFTYPLMKRITFWPQAFLGLTINWGALLGWAAVHGSCNWAAVLPLYLAGANWSLVYDTIYAHQDKRDDVHAGVKSTALRFGDKTKHWLAGFSAAHIGLLAAAGSAAGMGPVYFGGLAACTAHLGWQVSSVNLDDPQDCMSKFVSNQWYGGMLFATILADRLMGS